MDYEEQKEFNQKLIKMDEEDFDKLMCKEFPSIFEDRYKPMNQTCMCWGFCIGPGWRPIIHSMCQQLQFIEKTYKVAVVADQVKEKFGGLRFYYHVRGLPNRIQKVASLMSKFSHDSINKIPKIDKAKDMSKKVVNDFINPIKKQIQWSKQKERIANLTRPVTKPIKDVLKKQNDDAEMVSQLINVVVHTAENMSHYTCETCGERGTKRSPRGWIYVSCDKCMAKEKGEKTPEKKN